MTTAALWRRPEAASQPGRPQKTMVYPAEAKGVRKQRAFLLRRFNNRRHGTFGALQTPIRAVSDDLVASEFGMWLLARDQYGPAA